MARLARSAASEGDCSISQRRRSTAAAMASCWALRPMVGAEPSEFVGGRTSRGNQPTRRMDGKGMTMTMEEMLSGDGGGDACRGVQV